MPLITSQTAGANVGPQSPVSTLIGTIVSLSLTMVGAILIGFDVELPPSVANSIALTGPQLSVAIVFLVGALRQRRLPAMVPANAPPGEASVVEPESPSAAPEPSGELTPLHELEPMLREDFETEPEAQPDSERETVED